MSLILKQEPANTIATPPAGKSTLFVNDTSTMSVKNPDGSVTTFPTVQGSNTQVFFNDGGAINGNANLTFNKNTGLLSATSMNVSGNTTMSNLTVTGTLQAGDISVSSIANGTSNVDIVGVSGNVTTSVGGNANVFVVTGTGVNVAGTLNATGNLSGGNISTAGIVTATGNVTGGNLVTGGALAVTGNANVGNIGATAVVASTLGGTLTTGAQPNVTSVGTLTSLTVTGTTTSGNLSTGGNLSVTGTASVTGNANVGNLGTGGLISATGNVSGGNLATAGVVSATGNVSGGNLTTAGVVSATGNVSGGNLTTTGNLVVTGTGNISGNVTANNLTAGNITANTNVIAGNVVYVGNGASGTSFTSPIIVAKALGANYVQIAAVNSSNTGSADFAAYGDNGNDTAGFVDIGFTGSNFSDPNYTITGKNDGYVIANAQAGAGLTGSLVFGTGNGGTTNDIVFATGGFLAANEKMRFINATGQFYVEPSTAATSTSTGALRVGGGLGVGSNIYAGGLITATGNVTGGNITTGGSVLATANVSGGNLTTGGTVTATGNIGGGNLVTGGQVVATGNISGANLLGPHANGTSNVNIPTVNGNIALTSAGNTTMIITGTGANITGTANISGNANVGNIGATAGVFTGNITALNGNLGNLATANYLTGTLTTAAQPNVTSVGTLTSLAVTGNVSAGNVSGTLLTGTLTTAAQPNITSTGTLSALTVTGNVSAGNVSGTLLTGTLTTAAQPNVTSVGTLTSLTVTGNISAGNINVSALASGNSNVAIPAANGNVVINSAGNTVLTVTGTGANITGTVNASGNATFGNVSATAHTGTTINVTANANVGNLGTGGLITATGNVTGGNLTTGGVVSATGNVTGGNLTTAGILSVTGTGVSSISGNLNMNSKYVVSLSDPVNGQDAATKAYVDAAVTSIHVHQSANAATAGTLASATGGTMTYNNGASGVGANLVTTGSFTTIDGVNIASVGARILVKNEANGVWNGVYTYANSTTIVRATDFDTTAEAGAGSFLFVQAGTVNADTGWTQTVDAPVIGTDALVFTQFSGAGTYSAGTGLTLTGTVFSITNTAVTAGSYGNGDSVATFTVNGQGQLTAASNTAITANAANLSGTVLKSSVVTSSLTSVGTLGNLTVTGNISGGNATITSNTSSGNLVVGGTTPDTRVTIYGVGQSTAYSITGNSTTSGTDVHIAGADSTQTRITQDSFGNSNSYVAFTGRTARGSAGTPLQSQTNDILTQFTGRGFSNGSLQFGNASTGRIDMVAAENFTDTSRATKVLVYTTPVGAITPTATATFDNAGGLTTTGTITAPNITVSTGNLNVLGGSSLINARAILSTYIQGQTPSASSNGQIYVQGGGASNASFTTGGALSLLAGDSFSTAGSGGNVYINAGAGHDSDGTANLAISGNVTIGDNNTKSLNLGTTGMNVLIKTSVWPQTLGTNGQVLSTNGTGTLSWVSNVASATTAGTVTTAAQPNITSVGTLSSLAVTGNVSAGNVSGTLLTGTVTTNAQPNITSVGTLGSLGVTNIVTASSFTSNVATGTAPITVTSTTLVPNLSVARANIADTSAVALQTTGNFYLDLASATSGNITRSANATFVANVANGAITATTFVGAIVGSGAGLTTIPGANVTGTVSSATTAGTVTTAAQPNITSVGTLSTLSVTATITGSVSGSAATVTTAAQPNITSVGTLTSLAVTGNVSAGNVTSTGTLGGTGAIHLGANFSTGSNTTAGTFNGNFSLTAGSRLNATYADLAEKYVSDAEYAPGTVLVFGGDQEVSLANAFDSTRVAGVVTTNPAYTMNNECVGEHVVNIALQGRVPVLVSGNVAKGDLMVSGENGRAVANNEARAGTIIGKALANFTGTEGTIEVAVGRF